MKEILDTRFLIAHFFSDEPHVLESARARLRNLRRTGNGVLPTLVLTEFFDQVARHAGLREAEEKCEALLVSGLRVQELTTEIALEGGRIRCRHRGVPIADCVIAATAMRLGGRVVTDDPHFPRVKGLRTAWI
ncbi:MAG TPA: PIN domain-containing protein [Thermoplasmata archaeon]|nr:PIN domain-containing protein [Thermoplasmata archaeon]